MSSKSLCKQLMNRVRLSESNNILRHSDFAKRNSRSAIDTLTSITLAGTVSMTSGTTLCSSIAIFNAESLRTLCKLLPLQTRNTSRTRATMIGGRSSISISSWIVPSSIGLSTARQSAGAAARTEWKSSKKLLTLVKRSTAERRTTMRLSKNESRRYGTTAATKAVVVGASIDVSGRATLSSIGFFVVE